MISEQTDPSIPFPAKWPIQKIPPIPMSPPMLRKYAEKRAEMGSWWVQINLPLKAQPYLIGPPYPTYDNRSRKRRQWCDHCRKPGQTKDTRWKIHKKPVNWKPSRPQPERENGGHNATTEDSPASPTNNPFGKEQIEALKKLFSHRSQIPQCHWNKICGTKKLTF